MNLLLDKDAQVADIRVSMIRRFAVLLFVLAIVGQATAYSTVCGSQLRVHSCCKKAVEKHAYFAGRDCCSDENCASNTDSIPSTAVAQVSASSRVETVALIPGSSRVLSWSTSAARHFPAKAASVRYKPPAPPPALYLRHNAFLI